MFSNLLVLSASDQIILFGCPLAGIVGSIVRAIMIRQTLDALPTAPVSSQLFSGGFFYARFTWYLSWVVVGFASGLLVAFVFVDSLANSPGSAFRVIALALIAGYAAPVLWKRQEETLNAIVSARLIALQSASALETNPEARSKP